MSRNSFLIFLLLYSFAAQAEVNDTETKRTFFTTKTLCKLSAPKANFFISKEQIKPDGTTVYYNLTNEQQYVNFSFYLDTLAVECNSGKACLDAAIKNPAYGKAKNLKTYDHSGFSVAEFSIEVPYEKTTIKQLNIVAEKYKNGCWADIHISQVSESLPPVEPLLGILETLSIE